MTHEASRVYENDTVAEIASKIFNLFEVNQSCKVDGFIEEFGYMEIRGELVMKEIDRLDKEMNYEPGGKRRKRRPKAENIVGGEWAHKMFRFQKTFPNNTVRYTIWRIQ